MNRRSLALFGAVFLAACNDTAQITQPEAVGPPLFNAGAASASGGLALQSVSAGRFHSCGLTPAGTAYCWGQDEFGELGDGTNTDSNEPVAVSTPTAVTWASVRPSFGRHACGLTTDGDAYCWGRNHRGQLGDGTGPDERGLFTFSNVPVAVLPPASGAVTWASVSTGRDYSCGLTPAGTAYCWGSNHGGQLGDGTNTDSNEPVAVSTPAAVTWASLSPGGNHACGVTMAGDAYCWGNNILGSLGNGTVVSSNVPVAVSAPASGAVTWASVGVGVSHSCGVTTDGDAYCWGHDAFGELGDGPETNGPNMFSNVPVAVSAPASGAVTWASVSGGLGYSCGVTDGDAYCWGRNTSGQLGDGTNTNRNLPVAVSGMRTFQSVSAGMIHSCGLTTDWDTYCWGFNGPGRLGDCSTNTSSSVPVLVMFCPSDDDETPVTSNTAATPNPVAVGSNVDLTATVDDTGLGDSHIASAEYSLDGGAFMGMDASDAAFDEVAEEVEETFNAPAETGIYDLCVRGTDDPGNVGDPECIMLVVYDPTGGFVTGGGWITSPAGAFIADPSLTGKANFGFVSKYKKGATVPTGNTEFQFKAGDLNFHSSSYDFLVITMGGTNAQYKGSGTINGGLAPNGADFKFMIWARDESPDTFRIKIWYEDGGEVLVYDNGSDQAIGGGSIVVHAK